LPKHLPRVFEPFFSTREVGQGTGLGLSVSYGTLKSLGGDIEISSPPGQGVTVLIRLPL
jgi:two-component system NtrC family sensor kinase